MKLLAIMYEAEDGQIFRGNYEEVREECARYENGLRLRTVKARLLKLGLTETNVENAYNEAFPRRHKGTLCTVRTMSREDYLDALEYIYRMYGEPKEINNAKKLNPVFPMELNVLIHRGPKHTHCEIYQREIARGLAETEKEIQPTALLRDKMKSEVRDAENAWRKKGGGRPGEKRAWHGESHTLTEWAKIKGMSQSAFSRRVKRYGFETAMELPICETFTRRMANPDQPPRKPDDQRLQ